MGVEFAHLLIPRDNTVRPGPGEIANLAAAWIESGYVIPAGLAEPPGAEDRADDDPESLVRWGFSLASEYNTFFEADGPVPRQALKRLADSEYLLSWPCEQRPERRVAFPLSFLPEAHAYYDLQVLAAHDFVHMVGERLDPLDPVCGCGKLLEYSPTRDPFYASRIHRFCPSCGREFRPQDQTVEYRHPYTGKVSQLRGGACFRFAIRIDAGKGLNPLPKINGDPPRATPEFLNLCEKVLGQPLYEVGYFY